MDERSIGAVILELRKQRGMTQEKLAETVGVSTPAVSKWETNMSCPDVALLAPIARALDTDVNTLLSFTPTLSQEELLAAVKEVHQLAERNGPAAMDRILSLTRRYPNDAQLRFQLASVAMGAPQLYCWPETAAEDAWDFAEQGFEYVRQYGEKKLWPTATYLLAGLLLSRDKPDRAEALLDSLPVMPPATQTLYALLYQKRGQPERAWEQARMQLLSGGQTVLQALSVLAASDAPDAPRALDAYGAVAQALGYPPCLLNIQLAAHAMESGDAEGALEKLRAVARELKEEAAQAHPLWSADPPPAASTALPLGRMLHSSLRTDPHCQPLRTDPRFLEVLRLLDPEEQES